MQRALFLFVGLFVRYLKPTRYWCVNEELKICSIYCYIINALGTLSKIQLKVQLSGINKLRIHKKCIISYKNSKKNRDTQYSDSVF